MHCPTEPLPPRLRAAFCGWRAVGLAAVLGLSACAPMPPAPPPAATPAPAVVPPPAPRFVTVLPPPAAPDPADAAARRLLAYHEALRSLPASELTREQARLSTSGSVDDSLALALLLGQTRQAGDLARALALLDPLVRDDTPYPSHLALARLLHARLVEQRRLEELAERQAQQMREQQRRLDQLNQQLDALRAIERSLGTRPQAAPPASAPRTP
jgi:hypothetical protein